MGVCSSFDDSELKKVRGKHLQIEGSQDGQRGSRLTGSGIWKVAENLVWGRVGKYSQI